MCDSIAKLTRESEEQRILQKRRDIECQQTIRKMSLELTKEKKQAQDREQDLSQKLLCLNEALEATQRKLSFSEKENEIKETLLVKYRGEATMYRKKASICVLIAVSV